MDDRTTAYVLAAQPVFEDLRQVAAQLAGLLVLVATESKEATPDHPMLLTSRQVFAAAEDGMKHVRATEHARAHHRSLVAASVSLNEALTRATAWPIDIDAVVGPLQHAYACLQQASHALPGFPVVEMSQGCCALSKSPNVF